MKTLALILFCSGASMTAVAQPLPPLPPKIEPRTNTFVSTIWFPYVAPVRVPASQLAVKQVVHKLAWDASTSSNVVGYRIYSKPASWNPCEPETSLPIQIGYTTFTNFSDAPTTIRRWNYHVTAVDVNGLESEPSNIADTLESDSKLLRLSFWYEPLSDVVTFAALPGYRYTLNHASFAQVLLNQWDPVERTEVFKARYLDLFDKRSERNLYRIQME